MFEYLSKDECYGCGACAAVCPKDALTMRADDIGFHYPVFDITKCVDCNLCIKVCPERTRPLQQCTFEQSAFVCQNKQDETLKKSTSGGVFTALTDTVLDDGGIVYGAIYDKTLRVVHTRVDNKTDRNRMRGSKYVQSNLQNVFEHIREDLKTRDVLFTGTPCQVDAVKRFCEQSGDADRLLACDVVCYGVPSPRVFSDHINYLEKRYHCKIADYWHRPPQKGFQWGCVNDLAVTDTGKDLCEKAWINVYRQLFYTGISKRDSCYSCRYTSLERMGDITIGDCRQAEQLVPDWNLTDGVSSVIINSDKGRKLFDKTTDRLRIKKVEIKDIDQPSLHYPCERSSKRGVFFDVLNREGYKAAVLAIKRKDFALRYWIKKKLLRR